MIKATHIPAALLTGIALLATCSVAHALEFSGYVAVEGRAFFDDPLDPRQHNNYSSYAVEPELYHSWDNDKQSITITPFYRKDQRDDERTHADMRELSWLKVYDNWELTAGISKVYWGVTETQHLVDIINQTDLIENIDTEDKLGQPMLRFSTEQDWGILDFFILPGFRERTFAGVEGRPRAQIPPGFKFNADAATYESSDGDHRVDYAVRWFSIFDEWELGLSHFSGTGREPESFRANNAGVIAPYYTLINQTGLELQAFIEEWTWKMEAISRENSTERFLALTGGFEYTIVGIADSQMDIGIVIEYLYDNRDDRSLATSPFQNDLTTGLRFAFNDAQSSEILAAIITDLDDQTVVSFVEASRRLGDSFKIEVEMRTFSNTNPKKPLYSFRQDDFVQAELLWYF